MASIYLVVSLLVISLAVVACTEEACTPRVNGNRTRDGLYVQEQVLTNTRNSSLWFVNNTDYIFVNDNSPARRQVLRHALALVEKRQTLQTLQSSPVNKAVLRIMDSLIADICQHLRTTLNLPHLDCNSSEQIRDLSSRLETLELTFDLNLRLSNRTLRTRLNLVDQGEDNGRNQYWERHVVRPCKARGDECGINLNRFNRQDLRLRPVSSCS